MSLALRSVTPATDLNAAEKLHSLAMRRMDITVNE
jgi:hypothetical protein